ncbi:MAG: hypothetical protein ACLTZT_20370 [Butyricimonas faecalis]
MQLRANLTGAFRFEADLQREQLVIRPEYRGTGCNVRGVRS